MTKLQWICSILALLGCWSILCVYFATQVRLHILEILAREACWLNARQIKFRLKQRGYSVPPPTLYFAIHQLVSDDLICRRLRFTKGDMWAYHANEYTIDTLEKKGFGIFILRDVLDASGAED